MTLSLAFPITVFILYFALVFAMFSSLSDELGALFRVMWSGKWAVVSPHRILSAVWISMPFFKGYTQQDAQEFLRFAVVNLNLSYSYLIETETRVWKKH